MEYVTLENLFAVNLVILSLDHLITGGSGLFAPARAISIYKRFFGAEIPLTQPFIALFKPWGALGVFAGIVGLFPVFDPERFSPVLFPLVFLLLIRIILRIRNSEALANLGVTKKRNMIHIALISLSASLIALDLWVGR